MAKSSFAGARFAPAAIQAVHSQLYEGESLFAYLEAASLKTDMASVREATIDPAMISMPFVWLRRRPVDHPPSFDHMQKMITETLPAFLAT